MSAQKRAGSAKAKPRGKPFTGKDDPRHNAGGRPRLPSELREAFRALTPEAMKALAAIVQSGENESAVIRAAEVILERGWGKAAASEEDREALKTAAQSLVVGARDLAKLSDDDLMRLREIVARVGSTPTP